MTTSIERTLLDCISIDEPWDLVERFAHLNRVSGSPDEAASAEYIRHRLEMLGVPHAVHKPRLYLSIPGPASVTVSGKGFPAPVVFPAKTPSFSVSTASACEGPRSGCGRFMPTPRATGIGDLFAAAPVAEPVDLRGLVALAEGLPMPAKVAALAGQGAVAAVFISPGERIHEGICTSVWGTPDLTSYERQPAIPVASVSRSDGATIVKILQEAAEAGEAVTLSVATQLTQGWFECPLVVAEITGTTWPDEFVLLHGHLDSWHVGIGDNAVGNAALLEVARVLWLHRANLRRSVRLAWWPGHSTGRYAGSTWYADHFALDLHRNCVLHLNCDSPGCRWANAFVDLTTMAETDALARGAIRDAAGLPAETARPERAGDLSFSNIGVPTLFMLSSTISPEDRAARGLYAVGGCGGNNEWHTEDDLLPVADKANLIRDIKVYALAVWRAANADLHPLDLRAAAEELHSLLAGFRERFRPVADLRPAVAAAADLAAQLEGISAPGGCLAMPADASAKTIASANARLRRASRLMTNLVYSQAGQWRQDPALPVPPLPEFAAAWTALQGARTDPGFILTDLVRAQNRVVAAVEEVKRELGLGVS